MSDLKERLKRLKRASSSTSPDAAPSASEPAQGTEPEAGAAEIADTDNRRDGRRLPGGCVLVENEAGRFVMRECVYPADARHGLYRLGELENLFPALTRVSRKFSRIPRVASHRDLLFFDAETTGLGVGAGNVPFMLGIGFFRGDGLVVRQLFVRDPGEERAMLQYFRGLLASFTHLVSYNGRTFDWPVLKNRFVLNRIPLDGGAEHLDLLHVSRSLWRGSLASCRLGTVEEERLGVYRTEDISGALAPALYFQYLSSGDGRIMDGVFKHNEIDVLTLATLSIHLCRIFTGQLNLAELPASELFKIGVWLEEVEEPALAEAAFNELLSRPAAELRPYRTRIAAVFKKRGRFDLAVPLWERAAEEGRGTLPGISAGGIEPLIELAMYYEHRARDLARALGFVEEALRRLEKRLALTRGSRGLRDAAEQLHRRRARLLAKLCRNAEREPTLFTW